MPEEAARPIYRTISADLRQQINSGELAVGEQLPTEAALCEHYGVSRMTVRQALDMLVSSGLIVRRRGRGTFVKSAKVERSASELLGFQEDTILRGLEPSTEVLARGWKDASPEDRQFLDLPAGRRVWRIDRLRSVGGEPIGINHIILLERWGEALRHQDFSRSLYTIISHSLADEVKEADQRIEAVPASPDQAELLATQPGAPLLRIVRTTYLRRHGLIGLTRTFYRGDRYFLSLKVLRGPFDREAAQEQRGSAPTSQQGNHQEET